MDKIDIPPTSHVISPNAKVEEDVAIISREKVPIKK